MAGPANIPSMKAENEAGNSGGSSLSLVGGGGWGDQPEGSDEDEGYVRIVEAHEFAPTITPWAKDEENATDEDGNGEEGTGGHPQGGGRAFPVASERRWGDDDDE